MSTLREVWERTARRVRSRLGLLRRVRADGLEFHGGRSHTRHLVAIANGSDEPRSVAALLALLHPDDVVFDVGAYLGSYTLRVATALGPKGRVVAFEPDPSTRQALIRSIAANGLDDRVDVVPAAAGVDGGETVLHRHPSDPSQTSTVAGRPGEQVRVEVVRLDDPRFPAADIVKIDAEGTDLQVLRSLGVRLASVRAVLVEASGGADGATALVEVLRSHGLTEVMVINERGGRVHPWPLLVEDLAASYVNLLATRP